MSSIRVPDTNKKTLLSQNDKIKLGEQLQKELRTAHLKMRNSGQTPTTIELTKAQLEYLDTYMHHHFVLRPDVNAPNTFMGLPIVIVEAV